MSEKFKIVFGYFLIASIWGSTWLAIKVSLNDFTPMISSGFRFITAAGCLFLIMKIKKMQIQKDKVAVRIYIYQTFFSFFIPFAFVYWAEQHIESALASLLAAVFPFSVAIFSRFLIPNNRFELDKILSVILGFIGILIIFSEHLGVSLELDFLGSILVVLSAVSQAWIAVIIKRDGQHLNPLSMNLPPIFIASLLLFLSGVIFEDLSTIKFTFIGIGSVLYLAIFGTIVTFTIYYWLMKKINVVILSLISFISPIISVLLGFVILNEKLSLRVLIGGILVISGIIFANSKALLKYYRTKKAGLV